MLIFSTSFNKGSYISRQGDVGVPTDAPFERTEKGSSLYINESLGSNRIDLPSVINCGLVSTIVLEFRLNEVTAHSMLLGLDGTSGTYISIRDNSRLYYAVNAESKYTAYTPDKEWHQLIITRNNATVLIYLDNVYLNTITYSAGGVDEDYSFDIIGNANGYASPAGGYISKVAAYDHVFSEGERAKSYTEFLQAQPVAVEKYPRYNPFSKPTDLSNEPGLVAAYNMIPQGSTLVDISGSGNNGTLFGNPISDLNGIRLADGNQFVSFTNLNIGTVYTICVRCKTTEDDVVLGNNTSDNYIYSNSASGFRHRYGGGSLITYSLPLNTISYDHFYDAVVSRNGTTSNCWVNGFASTANPTTTAGVEEMTLNRIGGYSALPVIDGEIEDIKIYNYAFTEAQAQAYHNSFAKRISLIEDFSLDPVGSTLPRGWTPGTGAYEIKELSSDDAVLSHLTIGIKYLECTSAGTIAIPSKSAYGTIEFDIYSPIGSTNPIYYFISESLGHTNSYEFNTNAGGGFRLQVRPAGTVLMGETFVPNQREAIWCGIKITRTKDGEFYLYARGGSFGSEYTLLTAGSGSNPVTDNTNTGGGFFVADMDVGNRIANIKITEGVVQ